MKVAVYAIAKNEVHHCERFMASAMEADLVLVMDTGSTDDTVEKLRELGAEVHIQPVIPWRFDVARNLALDLLPDDIDICVSIDMDEAFDPGWRAVMEAAWVPGTTRARYPFVFSFRPDGTPDYHYLADDVHARHGYRWKFPMHESVIASVPESIIVVEGIRCIHAPAHSEHRSHYLDMIKLTVKEHPDSDRHVYYLGREYTYVGDWAASIPVLERHLRMPNAWWPAERANSMMMISESYQQLQNMDMAMHWARAAAREAPGEREPWVRLAALHYEQQQWIQGYRAVRQALTITTHPRHWHTRPNAWNQYPMDIGSICAWHAGLLRDARGWVRDALREAPTDDRLRANAELMGTNPDMLDADVPSDDLPRLAAVIITTDTPDLLAATVASAAAQVDICLVLTVEAAEAAIAAARAVMQEGLLVHPVAEGVNAEQMVREGFALAAAAGATWAVVLRPGEELRVANAAAPGEAEADAPGGELEALLDATGEAGVLRVRSWGGERVLDRIVRLPEAVDMAGPLLDEYTAQNGQALLLNGVWIVPPTLEPDDRRDRLDHQMVQLSSYAVTHADEPHWRFRLAEIYRELDWARDALDEYRSRAVAGGDGEEAAMACFRAAETLVNRNQPAEALDMLMLGLGRSALLAELSWLASYICYQQQRYADAVVWAEQSIAVGAYDGNGAVLQRHGPFHPPALYDGPFDVLRYALAALGNTDAAAAAIEDFERAQAQRIAVMGEMPPPKTPGAATA